MEAELKIQMKVPNREQAIVSVYSLEKKRVYFRPLRVFGLFSFMIFPAFFSAQ